MPSEIPTLSSDSAQAAIQRHEASLPAGGPVDLITKIEYFRVPPRWLFVRVETSTGLVGWGEATLEGHTEAVEGSMKDLARRFVGWPTDNIEDIWQHGYRARFYRGGEVLMSAMSGLDIALWDIKGKRMGVPVWSLLGGAVRNKIPVYCWIGGDRPDDILSEAKIRKDAGFKAVKMNATEDINWLDSPRALDSSVERLKLAQSVGLDVGMDFHGRLHKPMAKQLALLLAPHRPLFIEEPLLHGHVNEIADIAKLTGVPIALGERFYTRQDLRPYLEAGAVDIIQPDVSHAGGISECKRMADMAAAYDVSCAFHCPNGPIALAASMHMDVALPNFVIQEMSYRIHYNTTADLGTYILNPEIFDVKDGMVAAPTGPGLGLVMNEELIRSRSLDAEPWANPVWRGKEGYLREW